ncbi:hypothetical protein [Shinella sp.]|uniref:hypothetical protein n=1 Tax=Shinella sp. TaxID=1870904 RepID=UPI002589ED65|nr:hypothetical protein [Shinella sp.]MCW5706112.1 hypothetical protein [Shinella sp.]
MKIELQGFKTNGQTLGFVAHFDVLLECGIMIRNLSLKRPEAFPDEAWLVLPAIERDDRRSVYLPHEIRAKIGQQAAMAFAGVSGISLEYVAPRPRRHEDPPVEDTKKPAITGWLDRKESDVAGLHRVLAA